MREGRVHRLLNSEQARRLIFGLWLVLIVLGYLWNLMSGRGCGGPGRYEIYDDYPEPDWSERFPTEDEADDAGTLDAE